MKKIFVRFSNKSKSEKIEIISITLSILISIILVMLDYLGLFKINARGYLTIIIILLINMIELLLSEKHLYTNRETNSSLYQIRPRSQQVKDVPFEDCWRDANEIMVISIANTAFLKGQGLERLRKATENDVRFKIISLKPDGTLSKIYKESKILNPISFPLDENIKGYQKYVINYPRMKQFIDIRTIDTILPYSMMIVKDRNNLISSIKIDIYSVNTDIQDRRCFFVNMNDKKNVEFYLNQWDFLWNKANEIS